MNPGRQAVDEAVTAAGGSAKALIRITETLTHRIPYGARRLRGLYRQYRRAKNVEASAVAIYEHLTTDEAASTVDIGRCVDAVATVRGLSPKDALLPLVKRLADAGVKVTPAALLHHRNAFLVAKMGGVELTKYVPGQYPAIALPCLSRLAKGRMPWDAKRLMVEAARMIANRKPRGKRQVEKIVAAVLAKEERKAPKAPAVFVSWHIPHKPGRGPNGPAAAALRKAA